MFKKYGNHWSFMYNEDQYEDCIARWKYKELEHITEEPITVDATDINKPDEHEKEDI